MNLKLLNTKVMSLLHPVRLVKKYGPSRHLRKAPALYLWNIASPEKVARRGNGHLS